MNDSDVNPLGSLTPTEAHEYECAIDAVIDHFGLKGHAH